MTTSVEGLMRVLTPNPAEEENVKLCNSFSNYFITKITNLKQSISARLTSMTLPPLSNPIFNGFTLSSLPPVSTDEVSKLLSFTLPKSSSMDFVPIFLLVLTFSMKSLHTLQIFLSLRAAVPHTLRLPRYPLCLKSQV